MDEDEDEEDTHCPLCVEELDLSDQNFLPCPCGYKVCMWCWHHIRENLNGLCPACRTPYNEDPHAFSAVDRQEIIQKNRERKQKEKQEKKVTPLAPGAKVVPSLLDRRHLHNYRVVQRNLMYVIGVPSTLASEDAVRRPEYFGQYGKIGKVVIHRNSHSHSAAHSTVSAYITFVHKEDAKAAIQALDGFWLEQHALRASFGTTKYCNNFIRGVPCNNPECVYLHDLGDDDDRFTKEEIQAGHSKIAPVPGKDQSIVMGCGGPSGTGKRPQSEPILPAPVFVQDNAPSSGSASGGVTGMGAGAATAAGGETAGAVAMGMGVGKSVTRNTTWSSDTGSAADRLRSNSNSSSNSGGAGTNGAATGGSANLVNSKKTNDGVATQVTVLKRALSSTMLSADTVGPSTITVPIDTGEAGAKSKHKTREKEAVSERKAVKAACGESESESKTSGSQEAAEVGKAEISKDAVVSRIAGTYETQDACRLVDRSQSRDSFADEDDLSGVLAEPVFSRAYMTGGFNGLTACAVFPVPFSSLGLGPWATWAKSSQGLEEGGLGRNPFAGMQLPLSELLNLTLPPVDGSLHPWHIMGSSEHSHSISAAQQSKVDYVDSLLRAIPSASSLPAAPRPRQLGPSSHGLNGDYHKPAYPSPQQQQVITPLAQSQGQRQRAIAMVGAGGAAGVGQ